MHSTAKTGFGIPRLDHTPAIDAFRSKPVRERGQSDGLATVSTDPGQFIIELLAQFARLNRVHMGDEHDRRDRLGMLLDSTLDLKIIGDFLLAPSKSTGTSRERRNFDRDLRLYLIDKVRAAIGSFSPRHLRVIDQYQDGVATVVVTELTFSLFSLHFRWLMVDKPGGWRVCNLIVEDINLAALLREKLIA